MACVQSRVSTNQCAESVISHSQACYWAGFGLLLGGLGLPPRPPAPPLHGNACHKHGMIHHMHPRPFWSPKGSLPAFPCLPHGGGWLKIAKCCECAGWGPGCYVTEEVHLTAGPPTQAPMLGRWKARHSGKRKLEAVAFQWTLVTMFLHLSVCSMDTRDNVLALSVCSMDTRDNVLALSVCSTYQRLSGACARLLADERQLALVGGSRGLGGQPREHRSCHSQSYINVGLGQRLLLASGSEQ